MDEQHIASEKDGGFSPEAAAVSPSVIEARQQLSALLQERVGARLLSEQDKHLLSLRLGLIDGYCYTLDETACIMHKSPETIRCRQYIALRKAIKDLRFFKAFRDYAHLVHLPRGVTYYLYKYSEYTDKF